MIYLHVYCIYKLINQKQTKTIKTNRQRNKQTNKKQQQQAKKQFHYVWAIPNLISMPKDEICYSNGQIDHFFIIIVYNNDDENNNNNCNNNDSSKNKGMPSIHKLK